MDIHDPENLRNAAGLRRGLDEAGGRIDSPSNRDDLVVVRSDSPGFIESIVTRVEAIDGKVVIFIAPAPEPLTASDVYDSLSRIPGSRQVLVELADGTQLALEAVVPPTALQVSLGAEPEPVILKAVAR